MVATEMVLQVNHQLRPVDLGALAGCGHQQVAVRRKPRALIIPTGGELVAIDQKPKRGQLIEYNSLILGSQIREAGGDAQATDIIGDEERALREALAEALASKPDLILILSGSSAGSHDFSARAIDALGEALVHGVAVRPGHPVIIGMAAAIPVIGVPGYPVSAALTGELFVLPLIRQWLGLAPPDAPRIEAVSTRKITSPIGDDDSCAWRWRRLMDGSWPPPCSAALASSHHWWRPTAWRRSRASTRASIAATGSRFRSTGRPPQSGGRR